MKISSYVVMCDTWAKLSNWKGSRMCSQGVIMLLKVKHLFYWVDSDASHSLLQRGGLHSGLGI